MMYIPLAVHYVVQAVLYYWAPKQSGPIYYLHSNHSQPMTNGFVSSPLPPTKPVTSVLVCRGFIDKLQLFIADKLRRLKCKSDAD
jgi:hypothetical protein